MTETEKRCFEFVNSMGFENSYYSIDGQPTRPKSQFMDSQIRGGLGTEGIDSGNPSGK